MRVYIAVDLRNSTLSVWELKGPKVRKLAVVINVRPPTSTIYTHLKVDYHLQLFHKS